MKRLLFVAWAAAAATVIQVCRAAARGDVETSEPARGNPSLLRADSGGPAAATPHRPLVRYCRAPRTTTRRPS
jgi:hypothetical protein